MAEAMLNLQIRPINTHCGNADNVINIKCVCVVRVKHTTKTKTILELNLYYQGSSHYYGPQCSTYYWMRGMRIQGIATRDEYCAWFPAEGRAPTG